jgi:hypothetical protein
MVRVYLQLKGRARKNLKEPYVAVSESRHDHFAELSAREKTGNNLLDTENHFQYLIENRNQNQLARWRGATAKRAAVLNY